jgi:drug/metabolite transporter (DMT)-like permease
VLAAVLGVVANQIMFAEGMALTLPGHAAVINSQIPVLTLVFAVLARQERLTLGKTLAIAIASTGVLVLLRVDELARGGVPSADVLLGDLLVFGNAATFSAFLVVMRDIGKDIEPLHATAFTFALGVIAIGAYSGLHGAIDAGSCASILTPPLLWWTVFAIAGATVLTYLLNNWALRHTHSSQVALYIYLQPVIATSTSMVVTGERPDLRFFVAATLACAGVFVQSTSARR